MHLPTVVFALLQAVFVSGACPPVVPYNFAASQVTTPGALRASIPVQRVANDHYQGNITFGTTQLPVNFDTGSATDWVLGLDTPTLPFSNKGLNDTYSPPLGRFPVGSFCQDYGSGDEISGPTYTEIFTVGGVSFPGSTLGASTVASRNFVDRTSFTFDGVLGLAPPGTNGFTPQQPNWLFRNIRLFQTKVMGALLPRTGTGKFDFGFVDPLYAPNLVYSSPAPNSTARVWSFQSTGIKINMTKVTVPPMLTVIDSGGPLSMIDNTLARAYYKQVNGSTEGFPSPFGIFYNVPCNATFPDLNIELGNGNYAVILGTVLSGQIRHLTPTSCIGNLFGLTPDFRFQLLGSAIYQSNYIAHNLLDLSLGFARQSGV